MKEELKTIFISQIIPPHEPDRGVCLKRIANSIKQKGWHGRPILVVEISKNKYHSLTGSHRIAAARSNKLKKIPCLVIKGEDACKILRDWNNNFTFSHYKKIANQLANKGFFLAEILIRKDYE